MAEQSKIPSSTEQSRTPSSGGSSSQISQPISAASGPTTPGIGTIVLVRSTINSLVPAIVTNDFSGQNAPGVVSLIVFNPSSYDNTLVRAVPSAQAETSEISPEDLSRDLFMWWQPVDSHLAKRDLQKEIDDKRTKSQETSETPVAKADEKA